MSARPVDREPDVTWSTDHAKQLAVVVRVVLYSDEHSRWCSCIVGNLCLVLLVYLACIYELFQRTSAYESIDEDISGLTPAMSPSDR